MDFFQPLVSARPIRPIASVTTPKTRIVRLVPMTGKSSRLGRKAPSTEPTVEMEYSRPAT